MIAKNTLQSIISKYYLGGKVESVKWVVEDKKLHIDFMAPTKDMIGRLSCNNFPLAENGTLAIFVGTSVFGGGLYIIPAATYSVIMYLTSLIFIYFIRNR